MKVKWTGGRGEMTTRQGHRYTFKTGGFWRSKTVVKREAGSRQIFAIAGRGLL
jgi:hypothetical protein